MGLLSVAVASENGVARTDVTDWDSVQRRAIYCGFERPDTDESLARSATDSMIERRNRKSYAKLQEAFVRLSTNRAETPVSTRRRETVATPRLSRLEYSVQADLWAACLARGRRLSNAPGTAIERVSRT